MGRSTKKGPFVDERLWGRVRRQKSMNNREPLKTWRRECTVIPDFVGHTFAVHNGKTFIRVFVTEEMVGHKLGEFAPTRIFRGHTTRKAAVPGQE
jgi:small subunit ribosomal protein S19